MSMMLNIGSTAVGNWDDRRLVPVAFQDNEPPIDYRSPWWPKAGGFVGDYATDVPLIRNGYGFEDFEPVGGMSSRLAFLGTTRDQYGSALASCTCIVYRTGTREFVSETVSDNNGTYFASTWYTDAHFIVFYKAGGPDVFGCTVNTLIGS